MKVTEETAAIHFLLFTAPCPFYLLFALSPSTIFLTSHEQQHDTDLLSTKFKDKGYDCTSFYHDW